MKKILVPLIVGAISAGAASAQDDQKWYVQGGIAYIDFQESSDISVGGAPLPSADGSLSDETSVAVGIGYHFRENWSVFGLAGWPPETTLTGEGSLTGLTVADVRFAPISIYVNYHVPTKGRWKPFLGAGLVYNYVVDTTDGALTGVEADDAFGFALRAGVDYEIDDNWGAFMSVQKVYTDTTVTGTVSTAVPGLGGAPASADIDLDPIVIHAGVSYRF